MDINEHLKNLQNEAMFSELSYGEQGPGGLGDEFSAPYDPKQKGALQSYYAHTASQGLESEYPEDRSNAPHLMDLELKGGILMGGARKRRGGYGTPAGGRKAAAHNPYIGCLREAKMSRPRGDRKLYCREQAAIRHARAGGYASMAGEGKLRMPAKRLMRKRIRGGLDLPIGPRALAKYARMLVPARPMLQRRRRGGVIVGGARGASDWIQFVKEVRASNPGMSYKQALEVAGPMWRRLKR